MNNNAAALVHRIDQAFGSGIAERETEWLDQVFVPPSRWGHWLEASSQLILGPAGSGRTAVVLQMLAYANQFERPFAFRWQPVPQAGRDISWEQVARRIMRTGLEALIERLLVWPWEQNSPPSWAATLLRRLAQDFWGFPLEIFLQQRYPPGIHSAAQTLLNWALEASPPPDLSLSITEAAQYLVIVARALGHSSVWALLDPPFETAHEITPLLQRIAEVLQWFDVQGWAFKWFLPETSARLLEQSTVVVRRRMKVEYLRWTSEEVQELAFRRLQWATDDQWQEIQDVAKDAAFKAWVEEYGQTNPRVWLTLLHPFVLERAKVGRPLKREEWRTVARHYPPPLFLDMEQRVAYIGAKPLTLQPTAWRLLAYLYQNRNKRCDRRLLFYRALEGVEVAPEEDRIPWRSTFDSTLHRLREQLEGRLREQLAISSRQPLYIVSERGKGIRLAHATGVFGLRALT